MFKIGEFARVAQVSVRMLRHYDKLGLLKPGYIDRTTGYRYYSLDQLPRLHRLLALKDLGLSLEQVMRLLDEEVSTSELRGMLRLKQAELRQQIDETRLRLEQVERRLNVLEEKGTHPTYDVVLKPIPNLFGLTCQRTLPPLTDKGFGQFFWEGSRALREANVCYQTVFALSYNPRVFYGRPFSKDYPYRFEAVFSVENTDTAPIPLSEGFWLRGREVPGSELVASTLHSGPDSTRHQAHKALCQWMEQHGYTLDGPVRDIYLRRGKTEMSEDHFTEIQYPLRKVDVVHDPAAEGK